MESNQNHQELKDCIQYSIKERDTLSDIFRKFDVSIRDLKAYNQACDPFSLQQGQILHIKNTHRAQMGYLLQENETLWSVAKKFNKSIVSLLRANPNYMPQEIKPGIRIILPD